METCCEGHVLTTLCLGETKHVSLCVAFSACIPMLLYSITILLDGQIGGHTTYMKPINLILTSILNFKNLFE